MTKVLIETEFTFQVTFKDDEGYYTDLVPMWADVEYDEYVEEFHGFHKFHEVNEQHYEYVANELKEKLWNELLEECKDEDRIVVDIKFIDE